MRRPQRLIAERERRGWTRAELARRAKMHPADVGKLESGKVWPFPAWRVRLGRVLGIPGDELFADVLREEEPHGRPAVDAQ